MDNELFTLCKQVYEKTGWDNKASTSYSERLRVWQRGYSISEMGDANDDYGMTPLDERNKVNVYDWEVKEDPRHRMTTGQEVFKWWYPEVKTIENDAYPLYTSDYLLEKLPKQIDGKQLQGYFEDECTTYGYGEDVTVMSWEGSTPLKALLKLTLALSEAGEL